MLLQNIDEYPMDLNDRDHILNLCTSPTMVDLFSVLDMDIYKTFLFVLFLFLLLLDFLNHVHQMNILVIYDLYQNKS